jgi:hypothetical protein
MRAAGLTVATASKPAGQSHPQQRPLIAMLVVALAAVLLGAGMFAGAARAARSCSPPTYPGNGYFTSLKVNRTSCATGGKVALAWYRCRTKHSQSGHCNQRVLGFSCREKRVTIPTEFDARVTCHHNGKTVIHTYQQNT